MNHMRDRAKLDAAFCKRPVYRLDVLYLEVDRGAALPRLIRRGHADQQADAAALEEAHLWRRREEEAQTKRVTIEGDGPIQVFHRDEELSYGCVGKIHVAPHFRVAFY